MADDKWADCVYYFTIQEDETIFDGYSKLTINDKMFIIADEFLKKNDDEIASIFAISPVTVRSRRSKIRKKRIDMAT
jgi:DNA-directed RNA polymerase specialized sigma24 family protein